LKSADAVVVLWSSDAVESQWVRAEADAARSAAKLVQATLDGIIPPMPFNQIQCAELKDWDGNRQSGVGTSSREALRHLPALVAPAATNATQPGRSRFASFPLPT
jgi:hypothetical protein